MERVYLVEDGLGYGERGVFGLLSAFGSRGFILRTVSVSLRIALG